MSRKLYIVQNYDKWEGPYSMEYFTCKKKAAARLAERKLGSCPYSGELELVDEDFYTDQEKGE